MAKQPKEHRITCTLSAADWAVVCEAWDFYNTVRHYGDQDKRWRDVMPALVGYVKPRLAGRGGEISVPGSWDGFCYVTQWAASLTMGTAEPLKWVIAKLAPQITAQEQRTRSREADDE